MGLADVQSVEVFQSFVGESCGWKDLCLALRMLSPTATDHFAKPFYIKVA